jgi:hypothetical protein
VGLLSGKDCRVNLPKGGFTYDLTNITDNFAVGFTEENDLTYFEDRSGLVEIEFSSNIPWIIEK